MVTGIPDATQISILKVIHQEGVCDYPVDQY